MNILSRKFLIMILMMVSALSMSAVTSSDIQAIKAGNILHCFDWTYNQILSELDNIKAAGFTSIQTSPAQTNYTGSTVWNTLYRPRDTEVGPNTLGTKDDLTALCSAAHQKGLYIIVDVVANHTDGSLDWVADYWKNTDLYHDTDCNYSANDGSRWDVTHGDIGMCDLKTYDERVYSKFKTYIQALKACGVDGIRWDAAKHIGLPSEGDSFWSNALDKDMYNYGEVLNTMGGNSDATTIPELQGFMSVTDAGYSTNNLLSAFKGGGVPSVAGCWSFQFNNDKWVYWGESHDTFCNNDGASKGISQNVVDRAYAIAASHNNIPALYFSRPTGGDSDGPSCKAGEKGSTHFTSSEVAEINKFKLVCAGEPDYYSNGNGVCSVTRKSGAVIVKGSGSGNVSVANGGGYLAAGTYTDHVSGNTFTVTSTTITGNVGSSGIAVLYGEGGGGTGGGGGSGGDEGDGPSFQGYRVYLNNTAGWSTVNCYSWSKTNTSISGTWPGTEMQKDSETGYYYIDFSEEPTNVIFNNGSGTQTSDLTFKNGNLYDCSGNDKTYATCTGQGGGGTGGGGTGGDDNNGGSYTITYDNPNNWSSVYCYVWDAGDNNKQYLGSWPGTVMTYNDGTWTISFTSDKQLVNGMVIFDNGNGGNGNQTDDLSLDDYAKYTSNISTAIRLTPKASTGEDIHTLQGLRVANPVIGGIYIRNGRKVVIR